MADTIDPTSTGPVAPRQPIRTFPRGIGEGRFTVARTANDCALVWDDVPWHLGVGADRVCGRPTSASRSSTAETRWRPTRRTDQYRLCWHRDRVAVADAGNNGIIVWALA
jgi:hypothetical protein